MLVAWLAVLAVLGLGACGDRASAPVEPRVLVLGIDGMDPGHLRRLLAEKKMPNFARLAALGSFQPLATSVPPQSPVAWSSFITGMDSGGHGIFDFLRHDHRTFALAESTAMVEKPHRILGVPVGGSMINLRQGRAFWEYLEDHGIPATIFRVPANFPPVGQHARTFSGMGTPDLRGSQGTFTYYTDRPPVNAEQVSGGVVVPVKVQDHVVHSELTGPPNPFREDDEPAKVPLTVYVDPDRTVARIDVGEGPVILKPGEWSPWVRVSFPLKSWLASASGIVRFYLKSLDPEFRLYASPVNVDPADPAFPISTPDKAVRDQSRALGMFYTQGMPVDTKAFQWDVLDEDEFLVQSLSVLKERERLLDFELGRFKELGGFLFFYFSAVDLSNHMMWAAADRAHPAHPDQPSPRAVEAMDVLYQEMDRIVGRVLDQLDKGTTLIVMSDHGFAPYYRQVHLNNWLADEGFLTLYDPTHPDGARLLGDVDWLQSRAYAVGFNGVFLNLQGREAMGRVGPRNKEEVLRELERKLLRWRDPKNGKQIVLHVYRPEKIYHGPLLGQAPDLVVGYARGYRGSNATALGECARATIEDNKDRWSGDHMIAAEEVPGILLVNRPVLKRSPSLLDLPVTILKLFGIDVPQQMIGGSLFEPDAP